MADPADLIARVEALENKRTIEIDDIPLVDLMRRLEQKWKPDAAVLLQPYSITSDQLDTRIALRALTGSLRGIIAADASITAGTGFGVVKNGTGDFSINFSVPFAASPAVSFAGVTASENRLHELDASHVRVQFFDSAGVATDPTFFCIIALSI